MLKFLKILSTQRTSWLLLILSGLLLEGCALYFQHGMDLSPCLMCIYERVALLGIVISGIIGFIFPRFILIRLFAIIVGLFSAIKGLLLALKHFDYQINPGPWNQCSVLAEFPTTIPLDKWIPYMFNPTGSCSDIVWSFLGYSMVQWIIFIFSCYIILFSLLLISQFKKIKQQRMIFNES
ncbi:thiol:disulfide interchange protein DsbB [Bisgaardia hudsonensis]|uniref:Disulfide bond formation protein B n=1 Tax=Bisgaardia hudsonensis TaxID=109472 RepID=A0A4R2N267_9PAST|nr:disulfide bond formation protein DsbB [Bisgaardia hudsonensis]QLB12390.1 disulfide bond formation protein B [Bisgaardia hudsonensis]TCP13917.1 thiol:disulfide interchange protein DsbB [Bisgaardia hudsonensis]